MKSALRFVLGLAAGCVTAVAVAGVTVVAARVLWPEYAAAEPHKQYTLTMLLARLAAATLSAAAAACAATVVARDRGRAAWWLGCLFLVVSIPVHLYPGYVWKDYPAWYHLVYLCSLVPVTGLAAHLFGKLVLPERARNLSQHQ